jgi:hypothetical protein
MRVYLAQAITNSGREIKCEKCGAFENLEFHHKKYSPRVTIKDIEILCTKCHRNAKPAKKRGSLLKTVFLEGKRFCVVNYYRFAY